MVEILIILVVNALFCAGFHIITRYSLKRVRYDHPELGCSPARYYEVDEFEYEGMILGYVGYIIESVLPEWMSKPLTGCLTCMASVWGSIFFFGYWCALGNPERTVFIIGAPVYIIALAGLNTLIDRKLNEL